MVTFRFLILIVLFIPQIASAEGGLYGKRRISAGGGYYKPGNEAVRAFDKSGLTFSAAVGIPVGEVVDIRAGFSHLRLSNSGVDITVTSLAANLLYHFETSGTLKPGVSVGGVFVNAEASAGAVSEDDSEFGFSAGFEIEAGGSGSATLGLGADFARIAGKSDVSVGGNIFLWIAESAYLTPSLTYAFDEGDLFIGGGIGFKF